MADNFDKTAILESFLDEVNAYLPEIEAHLDRLQQAPDDMRAIEETYRRTHTINGSAAMMDFAALAHLAQGMEETLDEALERQSPLTAPTVALLRRSCTRLTRIVGHIRSGADDSEIVREDDLDRAAWRGSAASAQRTPPYGSSEPGAQPGVAGMAPMSGTPMEAPAWLSALAGSPHTSTPSSPASNGAGATSATGSDSFDSQPFATPQPDPWGASVSNMPTGAAPAIPLNGGSNAGMSSSNPASSSGRFATPAWGQSGQYATGANDASDGQTGFDVMLNAFRAPADAQPGGDTWLDRAADSSPAIPQQWSSSQSQIAYSPTAQQPAMPGRNDVNQARTAPPFGSPGSASPYGTSSAGLPVTQAGGGQGTLDELHADEEAVRRQVATLRNVIAAMREAAQAMEEERAELRGFLDGSSDALARLEGWVGQQMGLDLRQSPETVRNYLPLSVIWVTTTRLKKLTTLLNNSSRSLTVTHEQLDETLHEFHTALAAFGQFPQTLAAGGPSADGGFSATIAQFSWAPQGATNQQPTIDSQPAPTLSPGARAELERSVREELRRELEDEVRDEVAADIRRDEEQRIRQELEIQVRRQLLADLAPGLGASAVTVRDGAVHVMAQMPFTSDAPKQTQVTSEQSPEALEVFRDEAEEHVQTITTGIAQLEHAPGDMEVVQSIRRAMHTLKGAAGMMGFGVIQRIAHTSEDLLDQLADGAYALTPNVVSLLLDTAETLDQLISGALVNPSEQQSVAQALVNRYGAITGVAQVIEDDDSDEPGVAGVSTRLTADDSRTGRAAATGTASDVDLSVRLQLSKLDELVNLFGEIVLNRSVFEVRVSRLNQLVGDTVGVSEHLREIGGQLETRFEAATLPSGRAPSGYGNQPGQGGMQRPAFGGVRGNGPAYAGDFDELELDRYTEFHRLSRGLAEGVTDVLTLSHEMETLIRDLQASFARENRLSADFQERLLKARLVPVQSLIPRLYRTARASALRQGKEIEFFIEGGSTEIDRQVFEDMEGPLLHLVRNAVNHGIETPEAREQAGKPSVGKIVVAASYEVNQVVIAVSDDGNGINPDHNRQMAMARGWVDAYTQLTDKEALNLIFQPGFSTAESLTEESGRGVGLDVVRDVVTRLRGTVEVISTIGQGTTFTLKLPISLQIARAVLVRAGQQTLAIPMAVVEQIGRLDYYQRVGGPVPAVEVRGERYTLAHLASYLKLPVPPIDERASVLLINAGRQQIGLVIDGIVRQQEVVSKPLGSHLRDVPGVAGATVLGNGQVVLILELTQLLTQTPLTPVTLPEPGSRDRQPGASVPNEPTRPMPAQVGPSAMRNGVNGGAGGTSPRIAAINPGDFTAFQRSGSSGQIGASGITNVPTSRDFVVTPRSAAPGRSRIPLAGGPNAYVLVVDDSPSVRRVVSNMLKANGWEVQTARDGVEALDVIARQRPAAVLLDIEMPRMDGYELMATIRSQEQYRALPLIVLTSRAAAKHQQRATQLGADAYIVKPYQDEELLMTIANLAQARA
ncbi:MAG: response regulator [Ktedonobacterales bacterium]